MNAMRIRAPIAAALLAAAPAGLVPTAPLSAQQAAGMPRYLDPRLPFAVRADDLVAQMTLAEKISQMMDDAAAIPRLGVPAYGWWNEALHGVARAGLATSFPQAIGMAAAWDDSLIHAEGTVISDEARAKYNDEIAHDRHARYGGLTFWSPNINIFRDPRWGRGQETYGEDPFLTGRIAVQFIRGVQGDDPRYLKAVSTVKHFAVHSGPEPSRHVFDAVVSERDLRETYLAQFRTGIEQGGAYSLMCSYNAVYGKPACGSAFLLDTILRQRWGFKGYTVSDCDAVSDIYRTHKLAASAAAASAEAVKAGTDLDCGRTYEALAAAVDSGFVTEAQIDTSVDRLFLARMKLGMFDPPDSVPWSKMGLDDVDTPAHRALALRAARESMVLLKNQGNLLPLSRTLGTIAVIGPNADHTDVLLGNYNGTPADPITPLRGIREAAPAGTRVLYAMGSDLADGLPAAEGAPSDSALQAAALDVAAEADAVVLVLGITPRMEGEEMRLHIDGFDGGDRTKLALPAPQEQLLERIVALGKPTVLVLLNGSALAVNWANDHVPAILEAWYPGQAGGTAIAETLFGDNDPGGRLPVTFYRSVSDLPPFDDYDMAGRTYRFFGGVPLYPFGYGLSYTAFAYSNLRTNADSVGGGDTLTVSVDVKNTGQRAGDEVVQLYVKHLASAVARAREDLRGFKRVSLQPGETKTVTMRVPAASIAYWSVDRQAWVVEREPIEIAVGASSADIRLTKTVQVTGAH
jgi:beta-glucosidase